MFPVTPNLFIGQIGNQILQGPAGLHTLLHQPDFDPIGSMREVDTVVTHIYRGLGKNGEGMKLAVETLSMLRPDSQISVVRVTLEVLADFLRKLKKNDFEKTTFSVMQTHRMAFLWSARSPARKTI